ncbi:hypothetical protein F53441_13436 [Fusarium austroafricanum]|uniref:RRM domain-containing protein n=1 Tax=Fusarium austroafricanum TaxID=2364996 RepID=A0A8H4JQQ0_9HYPO|nr:hypothetical protein F53441_13436 [Fusarium austroafricanum]
MERPSTPGSHESPSSPELGVTPSPTEQITPFTAPGTNTDPRYKPNKPFQQVPVDSPSLYKERPFVIQRNLNNMIAAYRYPDGAIDLGLDQGLYETAPTADMATPPPQPQHYHVLKTTKTATPISPVRQPAVPPADHAASSRSLFPGNLAPSPAIWESLEGRFNKLGINDHQAPQPTWSQNRIPPPPIPEVPNTTLPSWLKQSMPRQAYSKPTISQDQPGSPTARQPTAVRGFRPMAAIARPANNPSHEDEPPASIFSTNYKGEHNVRNASAMNLLPEENCALWLTNLPPSVTHHELLAQIRNVGRIWCTVINEPDYERHDTAAAKLVFFTPEPAQLLLSKSLTQGLSVNGYPIKVTHNRVKYAPKAMIGAASRVLIITGKSTFVNPKSLTEFFQARFVFQIDEITELIVQGDKDKGGRSVVEYRFGSFRCQAQMGKMALEKDRPVGFEKVEFGEDPCEVGDTLAAYGIAAERIQGKGM